MKMMKRATALFLSFLMLNSFPVGTLAQSSVSGNDVTTEETDTAVETISDDETVLTTGKISAGTLIYKKPNGENYEVNASFSEYSVEILEVRAVDGTNWYRYKITSTLGNIFDFILGVFSEHPWVKSEDVALDAPIEPTDPEQEEAARLYEAWADYTPAQKRTQLEFLQSDEGAELYEAFNALRFPEIEGDARTYVAYFVDGIEILPAVEDVEAFEDAVADILEHYENTGLDIAVPEETVAAYEAAYGVIAQAVGSDTAADYPADELNAELSASFVEAAGCYYDALDFYNDGDLDTALANNTVYMGAIEKMNALLEVKPDLYDSGIALMSLNGSTANISTINTIQNDNVEVHVFNYGAAINESTEIATDGMGWIPFFHGSGYGDGADNVIDGVHSETNPFPEMSKVLINGYPYLAIGANETTKAGSLKYLFDKTSGYVKGSGNLASYAELKNYNSGNGSYQSMHFAALEGNSGLFKESGDYYYYNSAENAAWFNSTSNQFKVYNTTVVPKFNTTSSSSGSSHIGNFLPFNEIIADTVALTSWATDSDSGNAEVYLKHTDNASRTDLWFGMSAEFDFYMPEGGKKNNADMVFEFTGDDDVWVYIDDVLILDIGGTHGAYDGSINFATGAVFYKNSANTSGVETNLHDLYQAAYDSLSDKNSETALKIRDILENGFTTGGIFKDFTKHSFNFFYLERGGNISTCKMKFNMDPLPTGNVSVEKKVEGINTSLLDNKSYSFTIDATHASAEDVADIPYTIYTTDDNKKVSEGVVKNGSTFSLTWNQRALFNLPQGTTVTFTENIDKNVTQNMSWQLNNGQPESSATVKVGDGTNDAAAFICTNTRITKELMITKTFEGTQYNPDEEFTMKLAFKENEGASAIFYNGKAIKSTADGDKEIGIIDGEFKLKVGESIKITDIPTDTVYELSESAIVSGYYDAPVFNGEKGAFGVAYIGTIEGDKANEVVVTNSHGMGNLVITKKLETAAPEAQTFLFEISGNNRKFNVTINLAKGETESSVRILTLPYGEYTVKELSSDAGNWSWRYELAEDVTNPKTVKLTKTTSEGTVTFSNIYSESKWLSGDCYCENWWSGTDGIVKRDKNNNKIY